MGERGSEKEREGDEEMEVLPFLPCPGRARVRVKGVTLNLKTLDKESKG